MNLPSLKNLFLSQTPQKKNLYGGLFNPNQGGINPQAVASQQQEMVQPDPMSVNDAQEGQALSAYRKYLQSMPQRGNNTVMQKLVAALAGASTGYKGGAGAGLETTQNYLDLPYAKNMQSWMAQGEGLKNAASLEGQSQARENMALKNAMTYQLGQQRDETNRYGIDQRTAIAREKVAANTATVNAKIDSNKYQFTGKTNQAGNPIIFDKSTGTEIVDTNIDMFSDKEKLDAQLNNSRWIVQAQQAGANARNAATNAQSDTNNVRSTTTSTENTQARINAGLEKPIKLPTRNVSGEKWDRRTAIETLVADNPDLAEFVDPKNFNLLPPPTPSGGFLGVGGNEDKLARYKAFKTELDKASGSKTTGLPTLAKPNTNAKPPATKTPGIAVGTAGMVNGIPAIWDGKGWVAK